MDLASDTAKEMDSLGITKADIFIVFQGEIGIVYLIVLRLERHGHYFICAEGISHAEMLAFLFGTARESEKLAKRVSHDYWETSA